MKRPYVWLSGLLSYFVAVLIGAPMFVVMVKLMASRDADSYLAPLLILGLLFIIPPMLMAGILFGILLSARSKQHKGREADQDKAA